MKYEAKDYTRLLGTQGFSDTLLNNHFTLYKGYVDNTNKLMEELKQLESSGKMQTPHYSELHRRFGWEFNGMRLHEYYFDNMTKTKSEPSKSFELYKKMELEFGGFENWKKEFSAVGAMRGIGWAILYLDSMTGNLFNVWVNEHDAGHLSGGTPLLVLDVFEHAFILDYGLKRADYIQAFFNAVNWEEVNNRYDRAHAKAGAVKH